ncbi:MAG: hypothetical protein QM640_17720 [Niabella sp.]
MPDFTFLISLLPGLLILCAWLLYMLKSKTALSIVLFICSLLSTLLVFLQLYYMIVFPSKGDFTERTVMLSRIGIFSNLVYFVHAVAFFIFIKRLIKPKEEAYQFLEDSKSDVG